MKDLLAGLIADFLAEWVLCSVLSGVALLAGLLLSWLLHKKKFRAQDTKMDRLEATLGTLQHALTRPRVTVNVQSSPPAETHAHEQLREAWKISPGAGRTAADLIFVQDTRGNAERILDAFRAAPTKSDEAYPYFAFGNWLIQRGYVLEAIEVMQSIPESVRSDDIDAAMDYALRRSLGEN